MRHITLKPPSNLQVKQFDSVETLDISAKANDSAWNTTILGDEALFRYGKISSISLSPSERYLAASYAATKVGSHKCKERSRSMKLVTVYNLEIPQNSSSHLQPRGIVSPWLFA